MLTPPGCKHTFWGQVKTGFLQLRLTFRGTCAPPKCNAYILGDQFVSGFLIGKTSELTFTMLWVLFLEVFAHDAVRLFTFLPALYILVVFAYVTFKSTRKALAKVLTGLYIAVFVHTTALAIVIFRATST